MLCRGLRDAVAQQSQFTVVGEAASGAQALQLAGELAPDLVVMDVHLPDVSGIEAANAVRGRPLMRDVLGSWYGVPAS